MRTEYIGKGGETTLKSYLKSYVTNHVCLSWLFYLKGYVIPPVFLELI